MAVSAPEGDPFLDPNLPLVATPLDETVQSLLGDRGPIVVWSEMLNRVLGIDWFSATNGSARFMGGADIFEDGRATWFEEALPDISRSRLVDPATGAGITLQLDGKHEGTNAPETGYPLYVASRSIVSMIGRHAGPWVRATFNASQLLPTTAQITRGYDELPGPLAGTFEDPFTPPRTLEVEGITDISAVKIMSATYRAVQQLQADCSLA